MKVCILLVAALVAGAFAAPSAHVDPALRRTLRTKGTANIFVEFKEGTTKTLDEVSKTTFANREDRINGVVHALQQHTRKTQQHVMAYLKSIDQPDVRAFWITNKIFIKNANADLVEALKAFPEVQEITEEVILPLPTVTKGNNAVAKPLANQWGIERIEAHRVWEQGNDGAGVVVSNIDTGVLHTHRDLAGNFRSTYNWYDPYNKLPEPEDVNGHGTHTMGTIAGANGIGVAPGAQWIACLGCARFGCSTASLIACGEFIECPHLPNGNSPDCSKAPHIVSNSWGGGQGDTFYADVINTWHVSGIIPVFSAGNAGPFCGTANSPGDSPDVIGVGSTNIDEQISTFSSKGPSVNGLIKPDVSAPGEDVYSAWNDGGYNTISGTSMSCPHVAGAAALLLASDGSLNYDRIKEALIKGVDNGDLVSSGRNCGGIDETVFPNNAFGHGRINVFNSHQGLQKA